MARLRSIVGVVSGTTLLTLVLGCAGTDGVTIGDGSSSPDGGASTMASANTGSPLPGPPAAIDVDAGPMDFDAPVQAPTHVSMDAGAPVTLPDAGPPPAVNLLEAGRFDCVESINLYRASVGRAPLIRWTNAEACVDVEAHYDAYVQTPHASFRQCNEATQNECPSWPGATPAQAVASCLGTMWSEGPSGGNFRNMLSTQWTHVACGFFRTTNGGWWLIQNYR